MTSHISFSNGLLNIVNSTELLHTNYIFENNTFSANDLNNILSLFNISKNEIIYLDLSLSSILYIGSYTFTECRSLILVSGTNQLIIIGIHAFSYCDLLETFDNLDKLIVIGSCAFRSCVSLKSLNRLKNINVISSYAFENCRSLKTLTGLTCITDIYHLAFNNCISLESLDGLNKLTYIGENTFKNCKFLKILQLPSYSSIIFIHDCFDKNYKINIIFDEINDDEIDKFHNLYPNIDIDINIHN